MHLNKVTPRPVPAFDSGAGQSCRKDGNSSALAIKLLDAAADVMKRDPEAAMAYIARATDLLRVDLAASYHHPDEVTAGLARGGLTPWQMRRVTAHIDTAMGSTIRVGDCARIAQLSVSHFARAFKISFGETLARHVITRRVERVQEMMLFTNDPLSQLAAACGFADQAHLSRTFRSRVGQTPAAWRRQRHAGSFSSDLSQSRASGPVAM
jgi:AraC family transcriptional regulator